MLVISLTITTVSDGISRKPRGIISFDPHRFFVFLLILLSLQMLLVVTASTIGAAIGMLVGPSKTRRQHIAGRWIAVVLGLSLPGASYKAAEYVLADTRLANGWFAGALVIFFASLLVTSVVCAVWWAAVNVKNK